MRKLAACGIISLAFSVSHPAWSQSPCGGINRGLSKGDQIGLSRRVSDLQGRRVDVLQSFRFHGWTILFVEPYTSDEEDLFFAHDPFSSRYVALWGGGVAPTFEKKNVRRWVLKNAQGVPRKLASCFAWYVTADRGLKAQGE